MNSYTMNNNSPYYQIVYLPYIECKQFSFGNVTLYPFYVIETQRLFSSDVLAYLNWYFPKYIDWKGKQKQLSVVGLKGKLLGPWTSDETEEIRNSVAILCFLSVWDVDSSNIIAPDNFDLYIKNFDLKSKIISFSRRGYIHIDTAYDSERSQEVRFIQPENVINRNPNEPIPWIKHIALFNAMSSALSKAQNEEWFRRLIRAIKIFNTSLQSAGNLSYFDRILLLVTAFQTLLKKKTSSKKEFSSEIEKCIGIRDKTNYSDEVNKALYDFAFNLYEIRSRYTHGNEMKDSDIKDEIHGEYYRVGMYVFGLACKYILFDNGYIIFQDIFQDIFHDRNRDSQSFLDSNLNFETVIKNSVGNFDY